MQCRNTFESHVSLLGGCVRAHRCQALSKRSKLQCGKAALKGKSVCMFHGGKSTGPVTELGRQRCAAAKTIHGFETRNKRLVRMKKFAELSSAAAKHVNKNFSWSKTAESYITAINEIVSTHIKSTSAQESALDCDEEIKTYLTRRFA